MKSHSRLVNHLTRVTTWDGGEFEEKKKNIRKAITKCCQSKQRKAFSDDKSKQSEKKSESHVLANIKPKQSSTEKEKPPKSQRSKIIIIPLPILRIMNDHTFVAISHCSALTEEASSTQLVNKAWADAHNR